MLYAWSQHYAIGFPVSVFRFCRSIQKELGKKTAQKPSCITYSGEEDPVGDMGKGVKKVSERLSEAGVSDVTLILYEEMRHEILNEKDRSRVFHDILAWCDPI